MGVLVFIVGSLAFAVFGVTVIRHPQIMTDINKRNMDRIFGPWSWTTYVMTFDSAKIDRLYRWWGVAVVAMGLLFATVGIIFLIIEANNPGTIHS